MTDSWTCGIDIGAAEFTARRLVDFGGQGVLSCPPHPEFVVMVFRRMFVIAIFVMACDISLPRADAQSDLDLLRRVEAEYPRALAELDRFFSTYRGTGTSLVTIPLGDGKQRTISSKLEFAFDGPRERVVRKFVDESPSRTGARDQVFCKNSEYVFFLEKQPEDASYSLKGYKSVGEDSDFEEELTTFVRKFTESPMYIHEKLLPILLEPGFRFTNATRVDLDGQSLVKIDCERNATEATFVRGSLYVDPDQAWALFRHDLYFSKDGTVPLTGKVEYGEVIDGVPIPSRVTYMGPDQEFTMVSFSRKAPRERDFTLSAFGLPEIDQKPVDSGRSTSMWFWMASAAFLFLAIALGRLARRTST